MTDLSRMSGPTTCEVTSNATSSPESDCTPQPCAEQVGPMTAPLVLGVARANRSPAPERVLDSMIQGTCGQIGSPSLTRPWSRASLGLQRSLSSRLIARTSGSILYNLTWKLAVLPSQQPIYRLRASPRAHTADNDFTGWPTATTPSGGQTWPAGTSGTGRRPDGSKATVNLEQVARLAGWPPPTAKIKAGGEYKDVEKALARVHGNHSNDLRDFAKIADWSGWATTTTRDWRSDRGVLTSEELYGSKGQPLARQALYADATGSSVTTPASGLLNAEHSRWLLRIPADWAPCVDTAMRSILKRRQTS